ncbi:MAG: dihydrolipoamide dehydrogenase [Alphaproteobacteria bacterium]|nr:MAG: dihydrolipoamide dehydrogenase [Alphaproteobacteria bacterium]
MRPDLLVIGAGSGGLSMAAGAAMLGARVVLVERDRMGGECLNNGCVPSKALIAAARAVADIRHSAGLGIRAGEPKVDFAAVRRHVEGTIAAIAPHDSVERFEKLGVHVIKGTARFLDPHRVVVARQIFRPRHVVIAVGSRPAVPAIPGLDEVGYHTNETIFSISALPPRLAVLGGGPIGVELGQAFARLGSRVTIIEQDELLPREDRALVAPLRDALKADGIVLRQFTRLTRVEREGEGGEIRLHLEPVESRQAEPSILVADALLVAVGRVPATDTLDLTAAGIETLADGAIRVDRRLRTTNPRVSAIGDCIDGPRLTHAAGHQAGLLARHLLFRLPIRLDHTILPRVTYSDPEIAAVGMGEKEARARHGDKLEIIEVAVADVDRARCEGRPEGIARLLVAKGRVLGVSIVAAQAGELITPWVEVVAGSRKLASIASAIVPYPTMGDLNKKLAGAYYRKRLDNPWIGRLIRGLMRLR